MNISVNKFKGMAPKIEPRLLSAEYAQLGVNIRYDSGGLVPINDFTDEVTIPTGTTTSTIFKYRYSSSEDKWLIFDSDVMLCRDPIYSYLDNRVVISGLDVPRVFDTSVVATTNVITSSNATKLGIAVPAAPTMAVSSEGSGAFESRSYTIQYDRVWASDGKIDQGAYSEPAETSAEDTFVDLTTDGTVTISNIPDAPAGYGITHITINRSGTTLQDSFYHYVDTFNIEDAKDGLVTGVTWNSGTSKFTYVDDIPTSELGQAATNQDYETPPADLAGIISISSGMLAGYSGNTVCISEPYQCHAWPEQYKVAIGRPIVGLGSFGDILVVCTDAEPYIIQMQDPVAAIAFPIKEFAPCIAAEGIVSYRDAVVYPSYAGFMRVDRLGVANLTQSIADIRDMKDFNLTEVKAAGLGTYYYVLYTTDNNQRKMLMFNMQDPEMGFGMCDSNIACLHADFETASLYAAHTTSSGEQRIGRFDDSDSAMLFTWKSKIFASPDDTLNFSAARIRFNTIALGSGQSSFTDEELNNSFNSRILNVYPINGLRSTASSKDYLNFNLYVDGNLVFSKKLYNDKAFRLPAGFVGKDAEIELTGAAAVYRVDLATSMRELTE